MDYRNEQALERLVELFDTHLEEDAATVIEQWRAERDRARAEQAERAKQMVLDTVYYLKRVELSPVKGAADTVSVALRTVERIRLKYVDLPQFAKEHGIKPDELKDVLELRRLEVKDGQGNVWRNGHPSVTFRMPSFEQSAALESQQQAAKEAIEHVKATEKRAERLKGVPTSFVEPPLTEWKASK